MIFGIPTATGFSGMPVAAYPQTADQPPSVPAREVRDSAVKLRNMSADSIYESGSETESPDTLNLPPLSPDSLPVPETSAADTLPPDTIQAGVRPRAVFLEDKISGSNKDSLVYDVANKLVFIYKEGDVTYQDMNLKADYMEVDMETKNIFAHGILDTAGVQTRPEFTQGGSAFTMDTITYNINSRKAKIKGIVTQEGEGILRGAAVKRMPDNSINVSHGRYTTCDLDHPHFFLSMNRAIVIPGKKVIVGRSNLVFEDVPIIFPFLPFGFFPFTTGRSSGFIMPSFGEEATRGFFLRDGGYYFAISDYIDLTLLGGIHTLGSWNASVSSRYVKKYRFGGNLTARYAKDIFGDRGLADYSNTGNFSLNWTHAQDPKFRPNSTFAANVNFQTAGYNKYSTTTVEDYLTTQTNSSISYSKNWPDKPFSMSTSFSHSQNSRDSTISFSFPNISFNVSRISPFKGKNFLGKEKWYHKINFTYSGSARNTLTSKTSELFTSQTFKNMKNGVSHTIPVSASWTLLNYINVTPSFSYAEKWYFQKINREWDPDKNSQVISDTTYGFYRLYNYSTSVSASTKIYGLFQFKESSPLRAVRWVITPSISFSYAPDFGNPRFGYWRPIQTNADGDIGYYSPFAAGLFGVPGRGASGSIGFSLGNNLEAKIKSDRDTSGVRKIRIIDNLSFSGNYNLLADSLNLSPISAQWRSTIYGNYAINVSATFDPYQVDSIGRRINRFMIRKGKLARLTSASTSFGYTFNSKNSGSVNAVNNFNNIPPGNPFFSESGSDYIDAATRRAMMTSLYYDFNIPWNLGFSYTFGYTNNGVTKRVTQSLNFNGSITLTEKWGITASSFGYDFQTKSFTPGTIYFTRDLHCWQMNLTWVPIGNRSSWSFHISVKSSLLKDLKYDKTSSFFDNLYE